MAVDLKGDSDAYRTPEMVVDENGIAFAKSIMRADQDGVQCIIKLDAEQVELLLKILGVVDV